MDAKTNDVELTLLMPCLNEAETVVKCVEKGLSALSRNAIKGEVLVADNGSTDGSRELAIRAGARVIEVTEKGYGAALMGGIEEALGKYIIMGDADDSYDWSEIEPFLRRLRAGDDIVMGCRLPAGGGKIKAGAMPWLHRWLGNPVLSFIGRLFFHGKTTDFHCGMRGFVKQEIVKLNLTCPGMEFASEMVVKAALAGLTISEVPITLHKSGRSRAPHLRTFRDGWRHLRFMLIYSPRWLFLWPGFLLTVIGVLGFVVLLPGPLVIGEVTFDVNTFMVASLMCLLGTQIVVFGLFSRVFAAREKLLPEDFFLKTVCQTIKLEHGLLLGTLITVLGATLLIAAFVSWMLHSFGPLIDPFEPRLVITSVTLISLGVQVTFSSFFLSMLGFADGTKK